MRKLAIIGLIIIVLTIVLSGYFILIISPKTAPIIAAIIFLFSILLFHEFGHLILAEWFGYSPSAFCFSFLIIPSGVFREYSRNNKKHDVIIATGGLIGGVLAFVFFGIILISSLPTIVLVLGLILAFSDPYFDYKDLISMGRGHPASDTLGEKIQFKQRYEFPLLLVFSEKRWVKLKEKMEQQIGRKIHFKEVILG